MTKERDRRTIERMQISNGSVYYRPEVQLNILNRYAGPEVLIDISKSGAGFIVSHDLNKNDSIKVKFLIPGEEDIELQGHVKWISSESILGKNRVGMQFSPYGIKGKYNALEKLKMLGQLSARFQ